MEILYKKIRELRLLNNLSQQELADKTGYTTRSMIAKIEAGKVDLPQTKIMVFADALNTTPAYLMGWTDEEADDYVKKQSENDYKEFIYSVIEKYRLERNISKEEVSGILNSKGFSSLLDYVLEQERSK